VYVNNKDNVMLTAVELEKMQFTIEDSSVYSKKPEV
jgi:hypothetical protein